MIQTYRTIRSEGENRIKAFLFTPLVWIISGLIEANSFNCPECSTELVGEKAGRCPECDHAFDHESRVERRLENIENQLSQYKQKGEQ